MAIDIVYCHLVSKDVPEIISRELMNVVGFLAELLVVDADDTYFLRIIDLLLGELVRLSTAGYPHRQVEFVRGDVREVANIDEDIIIKL